MLQVVVEVMIGLEPMDMCGYIRCNNKHHHQGQRQQRNKEYGEKCCCDKQKSYNEDFHIEFVLVYLPSYPEPACHVAVAGKNYFIYVVNVPKHSIHVHDVTHDFSRHLSSTCLNITPVTRITGTSNRYHSFF